MRNFVDARRSVRPNSLLARRVVEMLLNESSGQIVMVVLTPESQERLLQAFPPVHPEVKAHHLTVAYDPDPAFLERYRAKEGQTVQLSVIGHSADERGQAVAVSGPSTNPVPHVTVSVAPGTDSVYSNRLLNRGWEPVRPRIPLEGTLVIEPLD